MAQPKAAAAFHINAAPGVPVAQLDTPAAGVEHNDIAEAKIPIAAHNTPLLTPELPKTPAGSEILLHLTGDERSAAAIRVADRAGSVSVSVHASDPALRESLRTNLNDLSAQLNTQGWKTETAKAAPAVMHSDNPQDSHAGGQRGGQQSSGGQGQPQRERRGNGGQWRQAFDQQIAGSETHSGGKQ